MKTPSSELYELIHSLGQNEKRYFTVFATMMGGRSASKNYTTLFARLSKQDVFDEQKIRLKGVHVRHFKRLKHYTTGMVLRSLENFYADSTAEIRLFRYLIQAEILFHKKQFSLLKKCLAKAILFARERDMIQYIVPLIQMEFKSSISLKNTGHSLSLFTASELKRLSHDSWRWMELRRLDTMFWNLIHTHDSVGPEEKKQFRAIARNALTVYRNGKSGYTISREAANVLGLCYRFAGDAEKSYVWRKKLIEVVERDKKFLFERSAEYVVSIGNLMNLCNDMGKKEEVARLFMKATSYFSSLPAKYIQPDLDERICNLQNSYVSFLYANKQHEEAIHYGVHLYQKLRKHTNVFMNSLMPILLRNIVFAGFYTKNTEVCNRYYSLWLRQEEPGSDVMGRKLFGLVMFYEQGEKDLLYYRCRSFRYALRKLKKGNPFALELEKFISGRLLKVTDKKEEQEAFRNFHELLLQKKKVFQSMRSAGVFDYLSWIKNKAKIG